MLRFIRYLALGWVIGAGSMWLINREAGVMIVSDGSAIAPKHEEPRVTVRTGGGGGGSMAGSVITYTVGAGGGGDVRTVVSPMGDGRCAVMTMNGDKSWASYEPCSVGTATPDGSTSAKSR